MQDARPYVFRAQKSTISPFAHFHHTGNIQRTTDPDAKNKKDGAFAVKTPSLFSYTSKNDSDLSLDLVVDTLSVKLEFLHEGACRTALAESVIDADLCNLDRILFSENIANCAAHAADN